LAHRAAVESLRSRIAEQGRNVAAQLARPPQPVRLTALQFDPSRMARLNGWQPKQSTVAQYGPAPTAAGASLLSISLPGTGSGSWRTQVRLEPGRYRFTGRAKAQDLVLNPGEPKLDAEGRKLLQGVGLRVSGGEQQQRLVSNADWSEVYCDFEIQEAQSVELVCELHAQQGQAFFDTASLKLVRR
jgi:hypothetical protein